MRELQKYVKPEAAKLPPEGVKAMAVFNGGPVKIVLVGDSTVATGGGWGPGFCAVMTKNVECDDVALNGRSSKSYIDEGAWKKLGECRTAGYAEHVGKPRPPFYQPR